MSTAPRPIVLVIDDDPGILTLVGITLRRSGMDVREAIDGPHGLAAVEEGGVEVVVCDLGMPGMSGLDVVRALRERPETQTLPFLLMTGSGDGDSVIDALAAGADDFLSKPIRLDELVARVRAHMRTQSAWGEVIEHELRARASIVRALTRMTTSANPEEVAENVVAVLGERTGSVFVAVLGVTGSGDLASLATFDRRNRAVRGGSELTATRSRELLVRSEQGPWIERQPAGAPGGTGTLFWEVGPGLVAGAPVYAADELVAVLVLGDRGDDSTQSRKAEESRLLAAVIDFASVLGAVAGPALADRSAASARRTRLRKVLSLHQYSTVYQPIIELKTDTVAGWEALTRFEDGVGPEVRFAEARANDLGVDFEIAAIESAVVGSRSLPPEGLLTVNISPSVLLSSGRRLGHALEGRERPVLLELSEHTEVLDYDATRAALALLGDVGIAVDDAGAGYASLRHLLELRPALAKLDISLVRGIHDDAIRQALVSGLAFYARRTGCRLVAEGVEEIQERDTLISLGVELGQGYLFGRPEPVENVRRE